ncbi:glyoxalase/bleomycin resistance/dioxygenase family protein [Comamonas sp. Tr-654]|uniref:VOC family protein n=1 Tax=Comamonas sp. Tr-654 TaxID=2608341 RepID=UPI00141FF6ED|nr:VOC family protein [Comamonas sp. Tr-654]NIF84025.1 glyoxalase/bleomycin resistance/dioxygenase family protein [Comamonas sp. Tr-654]
MPGPAAAGVLIYAKDFQALARFYEQVLDMQRLHEDEHIIVLESAALQLVIHALPAEIAAQVQVGRPPQRRADVALKFFVTVPAIAGAASVAQALGGQVFDERWQGPGFAVCNAMDSEGNVFQLRESQA